MTSHNAVVINCMKSGAGCMRGEAIETDEDPFFVVSFTYVVCYICLMALQKGLYEKSKHSPHRGDLCSTSAHLSVMSCFSQLR